MALHQHSPAQRRQIRQARSPALPAQASPTARAAVAKQRPALQARTQQPVRPAQARSQALPDPLPPGQNRARPTPARRRGLLNG